MNIFYHKYKQAVFICIIAIILCVSLALAYASAIAPLPMELQNGGFEDNPGTKTARTFPVDSIPFWSTTEKDQVIEIWCAGFTPAGSKFGALRAQEGGYVCELNISSFDSIFQDIDTSSGAEAGALYQWNVHHLGRNGTDTAQLKLGAPDALEAAEDIDGNPFIIDDYSGWGNHRGYYKPTSDITRFHLQAVASANNKPSAGNLIDGLSFFKVAEPLTNTVSEDEPTPLADTLVDILNGAMLTPSFAEPGDYTDLVDIDGSPLEYPDLNAPGYHRVKINLSESDGKLAGYVISTLIVVQAPIIDGKDGQDKEEYSEAGDVSFRMELENKDLRPGELVKYKFFVKNTGNVVLYNLAVYSKKIDPANMQPTALERLAPGESAVFTGAYRLDAHIKQGTVITDTAILTAWLPDDEAITKVASYTFVVGQLVPKTGDTNTAVAFGGSNKYGMLTTASSDMGIDFAALNRINADTAAWIACENGSLNYPVVYGKNNAYYLNHAFDKKANKAGCLFIDANNLPGFTDKNTVIYGHNMKDGTMFNMLMQYKKQEYFDAHPRMVIITPEQKYSLEIFAGYITQQSDFAWQLIFSSDKEFKTWAQRARSKSLFKSPVKVGAEDRIVTLSTCTYEYDEARFVLMGKLIPIAN